jgi:hypothetical protein
MSVILDPADVARLEKIFTCQLTQEEIDHVVELLMERQEWEPSSNTIYSQILTKFQSLGAFDPADFWEEPEVKAGA